MAYPTPNKPVKIPIRPETSNLGLSGRSAKRPENSSWVKGLITLVIVLVVIAGGIYLIFDFSGSGGIFSRTGLQSDWQAVFLTNGQVYFGKVVKMDKESVMLTNIYYLQVVTQPLQRSVEGEAEQQPEQRLTLIKLGNEIHGPRDEMIINRDHVVIIEDLRNDGRVVQAISDYISGQQPAQQQ